MNDPSLSYPGGKLIFRPEKIVYQDRHGEQEYPDPEFIRFGTEFIEFDMFTIGRKNIIEVKANNGNVLSLALKSYFGINKRNKWQTYLEILDVLNELYFEKIFTYLWSDFGSGKAINFENTCSVDQNGVLLFKNQKRIEFNDLSVVENFDFFSINSKSNHKLYTNVYFMEAWNSRMLFLILDSILKDNS